MKKIIALILTLVLVLSIFSGCSLLEKVIGEIGIVDMGPTSPKVDGSENPHLNYTLNQELVDSFYQILEESEKQAIAGEDAEQVDALTEQLDEVYTELIDQYQIAYVYYCLDQSDEAMKSRYLDCVDIVTEAESAYNEMCKRVYLSETPLRDMLFEDWTEDEIAMLLAYNEEIAQLEKRNTEITVEFRELDMYADSWDRDVIPLYNEMVRNNNRIAEIYGYRNYYEYAYQNVYQRDYDMTQIGKLRQYAAEYLPTVCQEATKAFEEVYENLSDEDSRELSFYVYNDYDQLSSNYVKSYIADMPESSQEMMQDMFDRDRAIFTNYGESYQGAFTTWIDGEPFCFFGQDYSNSETVIHEMGHYYGSMYVEPWSQPMDLSETQSQSNEWLFVDYLESQMSSDLYCALSEYKLSSDIGYIICFVMIDEFEEKVYSQENAGNLSLEEYDAIMEEIAEAYGGLTFIQENILDIQSYWKQVVLESPVYYVSYAVSGIAAINLYTMAQQDEAAARECFRKLMEEPVEDEGFLVNIENAGFSGPFDEEVYRQLMYRYTGFPGEII